MIYEIREYTTVPGRMPALIKRFKDHTLGIFAKHGMECVFISLTELGDNGNNELVYVMKWDSYAEMADKWAAMMSDPEWVKVKAASEEDGPIVAKLSRRVLNPGAFA
ncbi:NIPSNAP family protein [Pseudonocardia sp. H11422]|uniref:NIPSNAP family protein n=1 Tax=Pseudonocardia sp. H11422 TaxID=2835866 RepID=UPI001BDC22E9|nr:NIPSNAP family protein [Pseudonocardia sp. H11422]